MMETPEQIADRIAREHIGTASYHDAARQLLRDDVLSALRNERERAANLVIEKRDGTTARFAYGGYSRELWHLNTETLKTVCNELLKEIEQ